MKHTILVGVPSGGALRDVCTKTSYYVSLRHNVIRLPSCTEGLNFNSLWCEALNRGAAGTITHFAMTHSDVSVVEDEEGLRWGDKLIEELEARGLDFVSTPNAIKDHRGLVSSGLGQSTPPGVPAWNPHRRLTVAELAALPRTFDAADLGRPDLPLLHNECLCMFDMRKPLWYETGPGGACRCDFSIYEQIVRTAGGWNYNRETEDWAFSRKLFEMGAKTAITTRVKLHHHGDMQWSNYEDCGTYRHGDEDTAANWRGGTPSPAELEALHH